MVDLFNFFKPKVTIPHPLKREVKRLCRRYTVEATLGAFVDYVLNNKSSEYDDQFASEMEEAYQRYLDRRKH